MFHKLYSLLLTAFVRVVGNCSNTVFPSVRGFLGWSPGSQISEYTCFVLVLYMLFTRVWTIYVVLWIM